MLKDKIKKMESQDFIFSKNEKNNKFIKNDNKGKTLLKCIIILLVVLLISNINSIYFIFYLNKKINDLKLNNKFSNATNEIIQDYIKAQNSFCNNPSKFLNNQFEELIKLANFSFRNISYQMYVYKNSDNCLSERIIKTGKYEPIHMSNFLNALQYYAAKKNIKNEDIFILDIGGSLGVYSLFLGKLGYSILTFEASPRNSYILNKNYCLINRNSNIIIINKGLSDEEKTCNYYSQINGIGNGMILCDENKQKINSTIYNFNKTFEVRLTKLSNFLPYLSNKNIALIKLDIEGGEGKVIEDSIDLIIKYHIPYIFSEFNPNLLKRHGTNPKKYLELFFKNGYKISKSGFLNENYVTPEQINNNLDNLYFIYSGN